MSTWLYVVCGLIAILGRILGQALGARKDLANRNRQYRLERLVDAWRSIELAASDTDQQSNLEGALGDIQLFGTSSQVDRAARVARALDGGSDPVPMLVDLLEALRGELRREMRLSRQVTPLALALGGPQSKTYARTSDPPALACRPRSAVSLMHAHRTVRQDDAAA
jgi:hypothetical protein